MINLSKMLNALARHHDLIETLMNAGFVMRNEDNAKALADLNGAKVLVSDGQGEFRLSRQWREALERSFGTKAKFTANANVHDDVRRLEEACIAITQREKSGVHADCEDLKDEAFNIIWGMSDSILLSIENIENQVRIQFREEETHENRISRNKAYIRRATDLVDMLSLLQKTELRQALSDLGCRDVRREYNRIISDEISQFSSRGQAVITDLQSMLIKNAKIADDARRKLAILRAMSLTSAGARRAEVRDATAAFLITPNFKFTVLADPLDGSLEKMREEIASRMTPSTPKIRREIPSPENLIMDIVNYEPMSNPDEDLVKEFELALQTGKTLLISEFVKAKGCLNFSILEMTDILIQEMLKSNVYEIGLIPEALPFVTTRIHDLSVRYHT